METNKERMQRVLAKFQKKVKVYDMDNEEFEIIIKYPSVRNSEEFWDVIYTVMNNKPEEDENGKQVIPMGLIKDVVPKIILFIIRGYEQTGEITEEEKDVYSSLIYLNLEEVVNAFMDIATRMLGSGDVPKNPKAAPLQTD